MNAEVIPGKGCEAMRERPPRRTRWVSGWVVGSVVVVVAVAALVAALVTRSDPSRPGVAGGSRSGAPPSTSGAPGSAVGGRRSGSESETVTGPPPVTEIVPGVPVPSYPPDRPATGRDAVAAERVAVAYLDALEAGDCDRAFALTSGMDWYEMWCGDPRLLEYEDPVVYGPDHNGSDESPFYSIHVDARTPGDSFGTVPAGWTDCWVGVVQTNDGWRVGSQDTFG